MATKPDEDQKNGSEPSSGDEPKQQTNDPPEYNAPASQAELDRIIESRLARQRAQYGMTPEEAKSYKEKHEKLEYDLASEHEKALADATSEASTAAAAQFVPKLVSAKLDAAAARKGIDADVLSKALKFVDDEKFLNDDGEVDNDKITEFIDGIAPAKVTPTIRRGPTAIGHTATGSGSPASGGRGAAGLAEAQRRFGTKTA